MQQGKNKKQRGNIKQINDYHKVTLLFVWEQNVSLRLGLITRRKRCLSRDKPKSNFDVRARIKLTGLDRDKVQFMQKHQIVQASCTDEAVQ